MGYGNPLHGLDSNGDPVDANRGGAMSDPAANIPAVTADHPVRFSDDNHYDTSCDDRPYCQIREHHAVEDLTDPPTHFVRYPAPDEHTSVCDCPIGEDHPPVDERPFVIDLSYLTQPHLEQMIADGLPLPEGITEDDVTGWRAEHPDYDPSKPLNGQPVPEGVNAVEPVVVVVDLVEVPDDAIDLALDEPTPGRYATIEDEDGGRFTGVLVEHVPADADEPAARCVAATAAPVDQARQCTIHPDGAHHCYRGPGHQGLDRNGVEGGLVPEVRPTDPAQAPDWATHVCDCGFAWADFVQDRRPRRDGRPSAAESWASQFERTHSEVAERIRRAIES